MNEQSHTLGNPIVNDIRYRSHLKTPLEHTVRRRRFEDAIAMLTRRTPLAHPLLERPNLVHARFGGAARKSTDAPRLMYDNATVGQLGPRTLLAPAHPARRLTLLIPIIHSNRGEQ